MLVNPPTRYTLCLLGTLVQVRPNMTVKYQNQYFCLGEVYFNSRLHQPIDGLPIDLVVIKQSASLHKPIGLMSKFTEVLETVLEIYDVYFQDEEEWEDFEQEQEKDYSGLRIGTLQIR